MSTKKSRVANRMRISFDLDEVLFVLPSTHKTEKALIFPFDRIYKERLRLGTIGLIKRLHDEDFEVWIYTSSFRSERYIRNLFRLYGIRLDGIVNGYRHLKEVQRDNAHSVPQKLPSRFRISLHIDDERIVCASGKLYGFNVYHLDAPDDEWTDKIMDKVYEVRRRERPDLLDRESQKGN